MLPISIGYNFTGPGFKSLVDTPLFTKPDITVTTLSGAAASQSAEYVLTMLLALGRQLQILSAGQKKAAWPKDRWERFKPRELRTSTVGIIGYGSIGRQIARLLREFGTTVLATKNDAMHLIDSGYTPEGMGDPSGDLVHRLYPAQAVKSMVKDCDFVVVCVPLTDRTRDLINADVLAVCKPTAYLVDISRGGIVDHAALIKALNDHKLAGAALDVFPKSRCQKKARCGRYLTLSLRRTLQASARTTMNVPMCFLPRICRGISPNCRYTMFSISKRDISNAYSRHHV